MQSASNLFYEATTLMLVGMGFVYAFLSLLIIVIKTMIAPLAKRYPDRVEKPKTSSSSMPDGSTENQDQPLVAAISAAITQYRKNNQ